MTQFENSELIDIEESYANVYSHCPSSDKFSEDCQDQLSLPIPGGQATWWQCPTCGGWHVSTTSHITDE